MMTTLIDDGINGAQVTQPPLPAMYVFRKDMKRDGIRVVFVYVSVLVFP
jgi:hypothetical protein